MNNNYLLNNQIIQNEYNPYTQEYIDTISEKIKKSNSN